MSTKNSTVKWIPETCQTWTSNFTAFGEGPKEAPDKLDLLNNSVQMMLAELRKIASMLQEILLTIWHRKINELEKIF